MTNQTIEKWQGEYPAEVGNLASIGEIKKEGWYGIVIEVLPDSEVKIQWHERTRKQQRARRENKSNAVVGRVLTIDALEAAF